VTARFYTDSGMFTSNEYYGADASAVFNMLSGYSDPPEWYKLEVAPLGLRNKFVDLIENETNHALAGRKARIIAKMNSLVDPEIIMALYKASAAGVKIDLIIRGICCLKPGLESVSRNITVRSIVGRFLEHSRIYYFYNDGREDIFLSSADWMPRNLDRRVELLFPLEDTRIKDRVIGILNISLSDNAKARILYSDGKYKKVDKRGKKLLNSQELFCSLALEEVKRYNKEQTKSVFEPITSEDELYTKVE
jgi:polyphosphate kinase